jgi:hypothetical protein
MHLFLITLLVWLFGCAPFGEWFLASTVQHFVILTLKSKKPFLSYPENKKGIPLFVHHFSHRKIK